MDNKTTIQELKNKIKEFCEKRDWDQFHNAKDLSIGIVTESAELLDIFRFKSGKEIKSMFNNKDKKNHISEEISDILYFIIRLAQMYNIDLSEELNKKMNKNEIRYPIQRAKGSNKKYNEL